MDSLESKLNHLTEDLARARSVIRSLPNEEDYHFYKLFPDFKQPSDAAGERIKKLLLRFGSIEEWSDEPDEAAEWLVTVMDDLLEQVDKSLDAAEKGESLTAGKAGGVAKTSVGASVASHVVGKNLQPPVPLHIPTLRKPQELFTEAINNSNSPFQSKGPYLSYDGGEDNAVGVHADDWNTILSRRAGADVAADVSISDRAPAAAEPSGLHSAERGQNGAGANAPESTETRAEPVKRPRLTVDTNSLTGTSRPVSMASLSRGGSPRSASPSRGLLALDMHAKRLGVGSAKRGRVHPLDKTLRELSYPPWQFQAPPDPLPEPEPIDARPIELTDTLLGLKKIAEKLAREREVACDLEAHHYRSFQGFVCLMQLSTRTEDFVVDAIALREHIGPALGPVFADSSILKVLHGADRDVLWLQRDFGIYVVNMFDTGQAARQLALSGFGLGHLLEHFCGVHTDKRYQLADWRLRPLPEEMFKYARMDTHYLLYIYDRMRGLLLDNGSKRKRRRKDGESGESSDDQDAPRKDLVQQVLDRSRDLCLAVYEKELFRETSYLKLYKNYGRHLNKQQLAALAGLYAWRDRTAREQDESCGYILPKHLLLRLAEELPSDARKLQSIVRGQSPVVTARAADVIEVLRAAREQASGAGGAAFDPALWEGADVISDFLTPESPKSPKEGQGAVEGLGIKRAIGQSALGDPRKSAVGPSLLSVEDDMGSEEEEEQPEAAPGAPRGGLEATTRKAVVVKRAAGSALFGRPAKRANVAKGSEGKAAVVREICGVREEMAEEGAGPSTERMEPETVNADVRDKTVRGETADGSEAFQSSAAATAGAAEGERAESGRSSGVPTAESTDNGKLGFAEPGLKQKKRKGGLGAMFGARSSRGGSEETSAKAAAERVKASLALPFTPVGGLGPTQGLNFVKITGEGSRSEALHEGEAGNEEGTEESGAVPLEEVMMYKDGEEDEEEQSNGGEEEAERKPDPEAEKLALFGTQDLPKPISQAYRKTGAFAQAANGSGGREAGNGKKAQGPETSGAEKEQKSVSGGVGEGNENGQSGSQHGGKRALPAGPSAAALEAGCEGLAKDGKFDFAAAAGALGLRSFLKSKPAAGTKEGGKGAKPVKQSRGSKPEEQSYGAPKEEPGHNFNPFASMEEEGAGIKAGKRSQAFPRSGNRMSTFRR
ncbi:hypothetical protein KFL_002630080 [Klebsormidium nitens]|uniref:HRDC domain-containing protein n=1 Tax=Klebsormidium nitens TaxID=105231 RepID=A0A1Y1I4U0_KLENI|nr:hypothetical protein KFL_002630080 [Klebsormidium nitens]|eukprot:GAQ85964.1 hypothetical protein KFL_002630080 [Klebsormidium nitens]